MTDVETLADALPREMARVRDDVIPAYMAIGISGQFALAMMRASLDRATRAIMLGDVVEMLQCLEDLKGFST
jgi:hypothetical protein